ncbi:MAG: bifunctional phosphopantothenoylcysteine decarboxylase/phosphopantothenate--cysteine ligase CoaBC [Candidatus Nitrosocosmicus sp.]|nr:bifunctional phosphopantothenoylcysteine decarboxylase/phosphopantothenate--cysteine ligase CoaBC [Candidatus Nitrosocosmicus sp.]MDN5869026.1 bifunctional phosphopantothenoylcysteine decarboxylase/phosphopantothenate--cysteine ligase CoaBC [Candidatus Nitrosocosmicus sp.]
MEEDKSHIKESIDSNDEAKHALHPSKDIKCTLGKELVGKRVVICVTASVACYKAIDLIRKMMRHGAEVFVVTSKAVEKFINREYFLWASGNPVITELSGDLEHVRIANYETSDLIIVYPGTANTIGKFANGIDDTPVTSVLSIALGAGVPIIIAPAMHDAMYQNKIIKQNIQYLENIGIVFMNPIFEEEKAKVATVESVYLQSIGLVKNQISKYVKNHEVRNEHNDIFFCKHSIDDSLPLDTNQMLSFMKNKKILISAGSTVEHIDPIRVISNTSSGKMGYCLTRKAIELGLDVTVVKGLTMIDTEYLKLKDHFNVELIEAKTTEQMRSSIVQILSSNLYDIIILAAAVSDFKPEHYSSDKITSGYDSFVLRLVPTSKIVDQIKYVQSKTFLVAFKAEYRVSNQILLERAYKKISDSNADLVVANDVGTEGAFIGSDSNKILIVDKYKNYYEFPIQNKEIVAENILKLVYLNLTR